MGRTIEVVKHSLSRTISVICTLLVLVGIGWAIYAGIVRPVTKPNPSTTQQATKIYNIYVYPNRKGFSLLSWGSWHLISKDSCYDLGPILKEQVVKK